MEITKNTENNIMKLALAGRLDTSIAPELEAAVSADLENLEELYLDFTELDYISSAGLRVLLSFQKAMNAKKGIMKLSGVNDTIMEVFEITGFVDILTIE